MSFGYADDGGPMLRSIMRAAYRGNPCIDFEADLIAITSWQGITSASEWAAAQVGSLTNLEIDTANTGGIQITKIAGGISIFSQTAASSVHHQFVASATTPYTTPQGEAVGLAFFPSPTIFTQSPFELLSLDIAVSRSGVAGPYGVSTYPSYQISIYEYDSFWRLKQICAPFNVASDSVSRTGGVLTIDLSGKHVQFGAHYMRSTTGPGRDSSGNLRTSSVDANGFSHLFHAAGFVIFIQPVQGAVNASELWIGAVPTATSAAFDPTTFWRAKVGGTDTAMGPYSPYDHPTSPLIAGYPDRAGGQSGAVPGFGAKSQTNGNWGMVRRSLDGQSAHSAATGFTWEQPYHNLKAVAYNSSGSGTWGLDMGHVPTDEILIQLDEHNPAATAIGYNLHGSTDNWGASDVNLGSVADGTRLTGSNLYRYYRLTATLAAGPSAVNKTSTPRLLSWVMVERQVFATYRHLRDIDSTESVDPLTGQYEISELKLPVLRLGGMTAGHNDLGAYVATNFAPTRIEAEVYAVNRVTSDRYFLNRYRYEQREPTETSEEFTFVSGMDRLTALIPPAVEQYVYPTTGNGVINTITLVSGTTYRITPTGTPGFTASALIGYVFVPISKGVAVPIVANTTTTFDVTFESANDKPAASDTFQIHSGSSKRSEVPYEGVDYVTVYDDIIRNQLQVPSRYLGRTPSDYGVTGRATVGRLTADGKSGRETMQAIAYHCDGVLTWQRGQITFERIFGDLAGLEVRAGWDEREYSDLQTTLGADKRMPWVDVKYNYDFSTGNYQNEQIYKDINSFYAAGLANLFDTYQVGDEICIWNDTTEAARLARQTYLANFSLGVRIWKLKTVHCWPWLNIGDAVSVATEQYTDHKPVFSPDGTTDSGSPILGRVAALCIIIGKNLQGT